MSDTSKLIEQLRAAAAHRAGTDKRLSLPEDFIESQAADEIERLQTLLGDCRSERKKMAQRLANFERGSKKAEGWRKKT